MEEIIPNHPQTQELTISAGQAQLRSIAYFIPFALAFGLAFHLLWPGRLSTANYKAAFPSGAAGVVLIVGIMIIGVVLHELIHGLAWSRYAKDGFKSIRFGILWKSFTPYCHCKEPLGVRQYQSGAAAPGIILGLIPAIIALFTGNLFLLAFGLFFTMAAGGDLMIIIMLKGENPEHLVQDHPSKIGCLIYRKREISPTTESHNH